MAPGTKRKFPGDGLRSIEDVKATIEKRLFLRRLPVGVTEDEVRDVFEAFGALTECKVVPGRTIGYVGYETWGAAHHALITTDGQQSLPGHTAGETLIASFAERTSQVGRGGGAHLAKGLPNARVFVGGLPASTTDEDLLELLGPYGRIEGASLLAAKGRWRCGFCNFSIWGEALDAIEALDDTPYPGVPAQEPMTVVLADPRAEAVGGGGGRVQEQREPAAAPDDGLLAEHVKQIQRSDPGGKAMWSEYCIEFGDGVHDPGKHDVGFLRDFLAQYESEGDDGGAPEAPPKRRRVAGSSGDAAPRGGGAGLGVQPARDHRSGNAAEMERLKVAYLLALDGDSPAEVCTELHWSLMALRSSSHDALTKILGASPSPAVAGGAGRRSSPAGAALRQPVGGGASATALAVPQAARPLKGQRAFSKSAAPAGRAPGNSIALHGGETTGRVFIGNIPPECSDKELRVLVEQLSFDLPQRDTELLECWVVAGRGCGYIRFPSVAAAEQAIEALNERKVNGWRHPLRAQWARPKGSSGNSAPRASAGALMWS